MPISFGCTCGKQLQAKDEFAGKRMKCPGCGRILTIPGSPATPPPEPEPEPPILQIARRPAPPFEEPPLLHLVRHEPPPAAAAPAPSVLPAPGRVLVGFVCICGRRMKSFHEHAGEEVECPDCGRELTVPHANTNELPPEVRAALGAWAAASLGQVSAPWGNAEAQRLGGGGCSRRDERVGWGLGPFLVLLAVAGAFVGLRFLMP
ncbi:MAG: hypothetical protein IT429_00960 [Gemmataceae bacterium]|nr:hypothetical protein [Gemmataceae bacterium]